MAVLPVGFTARPATLDDVEAAVELANACSLEWIGLPEWEVHQFRNDWQSPGLNPETDLVVVFDRDGTLVGYGGVWDEEPHVKVFGWGNVRPGRRGEGIGSYLAWWVEERAWQAVPRAPAGARVVLDQSKLVNDAPGVALLEARGYERVRYFSRMAIELDGPLPRPAFPEGIAVRTFGGRPKVDDPGLLALVQADRDIFRDHWGFVEMPLDKELADWVHWIENDPDYDPALWFLAIARDEIAGLSLCRSKVAEDPHMAYVETLGVQRAYRRRGIALALLHHTFGEFQRRGKRRVGLDVDAASLTGATRLYEKAGMRVQRQSVNYEKELRPGKDLSTQSV